MTRPCRCVLLRGTLGVCHSKRRPPGEPPPDRPLRPSQHSSPAQARTLRSARLLKERRRNGDSPVRWSSHSRACPPLAVPSSRVASRSPGPCAALLRLRPFARSRRQRRGGPSGCNARRFGCTWSRFAVPRSCSAGEVWSALCLRHVSRELSPAAVQGAPSVGRVFSGEAPDDGRGARVSRETPPSRGCRGPWFGPTGRARGANPPGHPAGQTASGTSAASAAASCSRSRATRASGLSLRETRGLAGCHPRAS